MEGFVCFESLIRQRDDTICNIFTNKILCQRNSSHDINKNCSTTNL